MKTQKSLDQQRRKEEFKKRNELQRSAIERARKLAMSGLNGKGYEFTEHVPSIISDILFNFYNIELREGFFWYNREMMTVEKAAQSLVHFFDYYLLDDGDIDITEYGLRITRDSDRCAKKIEVAEFIIEKLK